MNVPLPPAADPSAQQSEWAQSPERSNRTMLQVISWISLHLGRAPARFVLAGISLYFLAFSPVAKAVNWLMI